MQKLGVGIIGTGGIARNGHAPAISAVDKASLAAVLSRDKSKGQDFLQRYDAGSGTVHTTLDRFVADPKIDIAIICTPDRLHAEQATACLKAGKHVLVEKPMTLSTKDALDLVDLAKSKHLALATGFHLRSHVGHRALYSQIVDQMEIGALRHIRTIWAISNYDDSNWRAREALAKWWSLSAVGSHCIDLARWFADDMNDWKQFSSVISKDVWNGPHDETAVIAGQFSSGPTVEIVSSIQFGPYNRLEIFGDKGSAICEGTMGRDGAGTIYINNNQMQFEPESPFIGQLENFINCIETNQKPRADGIVGLRNIEDLLLVGNG